MRLSSMMAVCHPARVRLARSCRSASERRQVTCLTLAERERVTAVVSSADRASAITVLRRVRETAPIRVRAVLDEYTQAEPNRFAPALRSIAIIAALLMLCAWRVGWMSHPEITAKSAPQAAAAADAISGASPLVP